MTAPRSWNTLIEVRTPLPARDVRERLRVSKEIETHLQAALR
jgi:hypothetical protein